MILGQILAFLKSLAKLPLFSLGPRLTSLNLLFTGYFPTVIIFKMSEMYLFFPNVNSAVSIWIFLQNLQTTTQVGIYTSENVQNFSLIWSLNMSKKIPSKITFIRFDTESSKERSPYMPLSTKRECSVVGECEELFIDK